MPSNQRCQNLSNPIFVVLFVIFYVAAVVCERVSERTSAMAQIQFTQGAEYMGHKKLRTHTCASTR